MMEMGFSQDVSCLLALQCSVCGAYDGHEPDCPKARLEALLEEQYMIPCPKCNANRVDINSHDYYECRDCHTQFSRAAHHGQEGLEVVYLDDPRNGDLVPASVLPIKGDGKFHIDQLIEQARKDVQIARRKQRRR